MDRKKIGTYIVEVPFSGTARVEIDLDLDLSTEEIQKQAQELLDKGKGNIEKVTTKIHSISPTTNSQFGIVSGPLWAQAHFAYLGNNPLWIDENGQPNILYKYSYRDCFIALHTGARVSFKDNPKVTCASVISHDIDKRTVVVFDTSYGMMTTDIDNIQKPTSDPVTKKCLYAPFTHTICRIVQTDGSVDYFKRVMTKEYGPLFPREVCPIVKGLVVEYMRKQYVLTGEFVGEYLYTNNDKIYAGNLFPLQENEKWIIQT